MVLIDERVSFVEGNGDELERHLTNPLPLTRVTTMDTMKSTTYAEAIATATHTFDEREGAYDALVDLLVAENPAPRKLTKREAEQRANGLRMKVHTDCVRAGLYA